MGLFLLRNSASHTQVTSRVHHFQPQTFTTTKQNHLHKPSRCNSRLSPSSPQPSPAKVSSTQSPPILVEPSQPQPQSLVVPVRVPPQELVEPSHPQLPRLPPSPHPSHPADPA